jgi:hypothetical protein
MRDHQLQHSAPSRGDRVTVVGTGHADYTFPLTLLTCQSGASTALLYFCFPARNKLPFSLPITTVALTDHITLKYLHAPCRVDYGLDIPMSHQTERRHTSTRTSRHWAMPPRPQIKHGKTTLSGFNWLLTDLNGGTYQHLPIFGPGAIDANSKMGK